MQPPPPSLKNLFMSGLKCIAETISLITQCAALLGKLWHAHWNRIQRVSSCVSNAHVVASAGAQIA